MDVSFLFNGHSPYSLLMRILTKIKKEKLFYKHLKMSRVSDQSPHPSPRTPRCAILPFHIHETSGFPKDKSRDNPGGRKEIRCQRSSGSRKWFLTVWIQDTLNDPILSRHEFISSLQCSILKGSHVRIQMTDIYKWFSDLGPLFRFCFVLLVWSFPPISSVPG